MTHFNRSFRPVPFACRTGLAVLLALALPPGGSTEAAQDSDALSAARQRVGAARDAREAAYEHLESMIIDLQDDYETLTGTGAATRRQALVLALHDSLTTATARVASQRSQGRPVQRGFRKQTLEEVFAAPVAATSPVDPRMAHYVTRAVAADLSRLTEWDTLSQDDVLAAVNKAFPPDLNWFQFWNAHFHIGLPEAEDYRRADDEFEQAGLALKRLQYPERYGPRGEEAPPGMVVVPGGNYDLGPNGPWTARPGRSVNLRPFFIDRNEVTAREYALFVEAWPVPSERVELLPRGWTLDDLARPEFPLERADHPVSHVSWAQAAKYARWAGKRLPSEDEWEAAAAGLEGLAFPWGEAYQVGRANGGSSQTDTLPVGSFPFSRSPVGCFDLAGNVWEWTATREDSTVVTELPDGIVNMIIRGGGWSSRREELGTRYNWAAMGEGTFHSERYTRPIGFRCAKDM